MAVKLWNSPTSMLVWRTSLAVQLLRLHAPGIWGRMDMCICMAEFLHCSPETVTTWLISYTSIQKEKLKKKDSRLPGIRGRMDTCICTAESFHGSPETVTTWLTVHLYSCIHQYKRKGFKKKDSELPVQQARVQSLVGEIRSQCCKMQLREKEKDAWMRNSSTSPMYGF